MGGLEMGLAEGANGEGDCDASKASYLATRERMWDLGEIVGGL